jgi:hypothetical protein
MSDADTPPAVAALREDLREGRARLFAPLQGLTEEQFRFTGDDGWNIATQLAHVLRCERMLADRTTRALREHEPAVRSTGITNDDDPALAQRLAVPQIVHGLQASRRVVDAIVETLDDTSFDRAIIHERDGRVAVRQLMTKMAAHEHEHAAVVELLARRARTAGSTAIPVIQP